MSDRYFNPEERIREKHLAREQDQRDLREGRVSAKELRARNSLVHGLDISGAEIDFGKPLR
jgi:hypothetical protein